MLLFNLVLLFTGFQGASAEIPGQPGTNSTATDSDPVSTETNTPQDLSSPAAQQELKADQAPQPVTPTKTDERFGPQVDPCFTVTVEGDTWLDQVHGFVQDNTCEPAVWFDTFFVKDHVLLDLRPGMYIILRNSARWNDGHAVSYLPNVNVRWKLPQWEKMLRRFSLYFESRSDDNRYTTQPGQPVEPGVDPNTGVKRSIVGLRVDLYTRLRALFSIDTGLVVSMRPDAHIRMRFQYTKPFSEVYLIRFSEIAMWQTIEHFTNTVQLDLERKITAFTFVRWGNNVTYTEGTLGVTWNTGISLFTQLTPKSAISYDTSMWGVNHPHWKMVNYRVGSLYRRNFYRRYLFFDLAPEVTWPIDENGRRSPAYAFMATLEMQFGK